jgi:hypothetical protein
MYVKNPKYSLTGRKKLKKYGWLVPDKHREPDYIGINGRLFYKQAIREIIFYRHSVQIVSSLKGTPVFLLMNFN